MANEPKGGHSGADSRLRVEFEAWNEFPISSLLRHSISLFRRVGNLGENAMQFSSLHGV